jgi:hypothetical protein
VTFPTAPAPTFATAFPFPGPPSKAKAEKDAPQAGRFTAKAAARNKARLRRAAEALGHLPARGESVHFLIESYFDPADLIAVVVEHALTVCTHLRTATLSFSTRNVRQLVGLIDRGLVRRLTLLCSDWMAKANAKVYALAVEELAAKRGAVVASARSHCKVSVLDFGTFDDGTPDALVFEGSGNLSSCRTIEQVTCIRDAGLAEWHSRWVDRLAAREPQKP